MVANQDLTQFEKDLNLGLHEASEGEVGFEGTEFERELQAELQRPEPITAFDPEAITRKFSGAPRTGKSMVTGLRDYEDVMDSVRIRRVEAMLEAGQQPSQEDLQWYSEVQEFRSRRRTIGAKALGIMLDSFVYAQDFALGGFTLKKLGLEAVEEAATKAAEKHVLRELVEQGAKGVARVAVAEAEKEAVGMAGAPVASRFRADFQTELEMLKSKWGLDDEMGGSLLTAMLSGREEVVRSLYRAGLKGAIQGGSEMLGGTLAKLPVLKRVAAFQHAAVNRLLGQGVSIPEAVEMVARGVAYDGWFQEILEERAGDIASAALGLTTWEEAIPELSDFAAESIALGVPGAAGVAVARLRGERVEGAVPATPPGSLPAPEEPAEGVSPEAAGPEGVQPEKAPESTIGTPTVPRGTLAEDLGRVARAEGKPVEGYGEVQAQTAEQQLAVRRGEERGIKVRIVSGMSHEGVSVRPGEVLISDQAREPARAIFYHEAVHDLSRRLGFEEGDDSSAWNLYRRIRKVDRAGMRLGRSTHRDRTIAMYRERGMSEEEARAAYRRAFSRAAMREEGFATYAQDIVSYLELATQEKGRERLLKLAKDPTLWDAVKQWIRETWGRITGRDPEARMRELEASLGIEGPLENREAAVAALMLQEAWAQAPQAQPVEATPPRFEGPRGAPPADEEAEIAADRARRGIREPSPEDMEALRRTLSETPPEQWAQAVRDWAGLEAEEAPVSEAETAQAMAEERYTVTEEAPMRLPSGGMRTPVRLETPEGAYLEASLSEDTIYVEDVEVPEAMRRQGIARSMYQALARRYPQHRFGRSAYRTEAGAALRETIDKDLPREMFAPAAWHGSAADFDEFRDEKIGTGEGAQAFGYGHYFAGKREVAEWYRANAAPEGRPEIDGEPIMLGSMFGQDWDIAAQNTAYNDNRRPVRASDYRETATRLIPRLEDELARYEGYSGPELPEGRELMRQNGIKALRKQLDQLRRFSAGEGEYRRGGRLYKVDLAPAEDEYLLWDEPLSAQSEKVKAAIGFGQSSRLEENYKKANAEYRRARREREAQEPGRGWYDEIFGELNEAESNAFQKLQAAERARSKQDVFEAAMRFNPALDALRERHGQQVGVYGKEFYQRLSANGGSDRAASQALLSAGIRGIKYRDATSRGVSKWHADLADSMMEKHGGDKAAAAQEARDRIPGWDANIVAGMIESGEREGSYNYVVFDPKDIKIEERFAPAPPRDSEAFKRWFGDSKVVDENGEPLVVYHATTHAFTEFAPDRGNIENHLGVAYYFTDSATDASENYADPEKSPDLTQRVTLRAEQIADENDWDYDDPRAMAQAQRELVGASPSIIPAYLSLSNPLDLRTPPYWETAYDEDTGEESGELTDFIMALRHVASQYDDVDIARAESEAAGDMEGRADEILQRARESEGLAYATDEEGRLASSEIIRRVLEEMGYDGVIMDAEAAFGAGRAFGRGMENVEGATHYIAFRPSQIKSATGNRGTYDPANPDIRFAAARGLPQRIGEPDLAALEQQRQRALAGEQIGRPDLAITTTEPELAAIQQAVDELRNRAGQPETVDMRQIQEIARQAVRADAAGITRALLRKIKRGEALGVGEVFAMREVTHATAKLALNSGDEIRWREAYMLHWAYRQSGADQARAFAARQSRFSRETRGEEMMALILARPTYKTQKRLDALYAERNRDGTTEERQAEIDAEIETLLAGEAKRNAKVYAALKAEGYDPATITQYHWEDAATSSRLLRIVSTNRATAGEKAREFLYASVLSFPFTHMRNWRGNLINLGVSKHFQEIIEAGVNVIVRDPNSPSFKEAKVVMRSVIPGMAEAFRRFFNAYRYEQMAMGGMNQQDTTKWAEEVRGRAIGATKLGRAAFAPLRWISLDLLTAVDEAFKGYISTVAVAQLAYREAKKEGVESPEALERRMGELMLDPEVVMRATQEELNLTFQDKAAPGTWTHGLEKGAMWLRDKLDSIPGAPMPGTLILMFVKTPLRLAREAMRRSPAVWIPYVHNLAAAMAKGGKYKGGKRKAVQDTADAIIAGIIFYGVMSLIDDEDEFGVPVLGGAPSSDWDERLLQYRTRGPNTIRLGGVTYNYRNTDPIANAVATTVDAVRAYREQGIGGAVRGGFGSIQRNLRDATYLRAIGDLYELAEGRRNPTEWAAETFVTPWVPNIIKGGLRERDQFVREQRVREMGEMTRNEALLYRMRYKLAPASEIAPPPKHDVWGRPLTRTPITMNNGILLERSLSSGDPLRIDAMLWKYNSKVRRGELSEEAVTWAPRPPSYESSDRGKKIHWTDGEYQELVRDGGRGAAEELLGMNLNWDDPTEEDMKTVQRIYKRHMDRVRNRLKKERRAKEGGS